MAIPSYYKSPTTIDPFSGSGTTGIAANLLGRRYLGLEIETEFLDMSRRRREELDNPSLRDAYLTRLSRAGVIPHPDTLPPRRPRRRARLRHPLATRKGR